jgi:hypothetical protein
MNEVCKKRATKAFRYFCDTMGIDRKRVVLRFVDGSKLNVNEGVESVYGDTETVACVEMPMGCRKKHYVYISNREGISGDMVVESVAHELVHVKQNMDGRLRCFGTSDVDMSYEFEGVRHATFNDHNDYMNAPWEVEARVESRNMVVAFNRYMRELGGYRVVKKLN